MKCSQNSKWPKIYLRTTCKYKITRLSIVLGRLQSRKTNTMTKRILDWWLSSASLPEFSRKTVEPCDKFPLVTWTCRLRGEASPGCCCCCCCCCCCSCCCCGKFSSRVGRRDSRSMFCVGDSSFCWLEVVGSGWRCWWVCQMKKNHPMRAKGSFK